MTVIDTKSRYLIITFMKKDQSPDHLENLLAHLNNESYPKPRLLHTDNAMEYLSHKRKHCKTHKEYNTEPQSPTHPEVTGLQRE